MKCFTPMVRCKTVNKEFFDVLGNDMHADKYKICILNTPNYIDIRSQSKQLHLGPFQVLINFFNSFKVTQFWMSVGKLFHIF